MINQGQAPLVKLESIKLIFIRIRVQDVHFRIPNFQPLSNYWGTKCYFSLAIHLTTEKYLHDLPSKNLKKSQNSTIKFLKNNIRKCMGFQVILRSLNECFAESEVTCSQITLIHQKFVPFFPLCWLYKNLRFCRCCGIFCQAIFTHPGDLIVMELMNSWVQSRGACQSERKLCSPPMPVEARLSSHPDPPWTWKSNLLGLNPSILNLSVVYLCWISNLIIQ